MRQAICMLHEIQENETRSFQLNEKSIFLVKKDNTLFAYLNNCPHLNINLEAQPDTFLDLDQSFIQCANHGALFEIATGNCISGPCQGQSLQPVDFSIENDQVWLTE